VRERDATITLVAILAFVAGAAAPALAATETYQIDPVHSMVGFKIRHFVSKFPGRFGKYSGTISLDPSNLATTKVSVEIDTASIDTDNQDRDTLLKSADFFDVATHPKMTFVSTEVIPKGEGKATLKGTLTLRGVSKPVDLDVDVLGFSPDTWGGYRGGFEARGTINRKEFGILWNQTLDTGGAMLGDEVEIMLNIEAVREKPAAPAKAGR